MASQNITHFMVRFTYFTHFYNINTAAQIDKNQVKSLFGTSKKYPENFEILLRVLQLIQ